MSPTERLTIEEVAVELKLTPQTVRNWIKSGKLRATKHGHVFRVTREDLDAMFERDEGETSPMGSHRDLWDPETLGSPYRPDEALPKPSIWDAAGNPPLPLKRS
jgi:excisionase family DNA binding protein